jgi:hypothetical protein
VVAVVSNDPAGGSLGDAADAPDHTVLRLVHLPTAPALDAMDVKRRAEGRLVDARADVRVIGSSHCLSLPALGFHELCSCRPLPDLGVETVNNPAEPDGGAVAPAPAAAATATVPTRRVRRIPLAPGVERTVTTVTGDVRAATTVEGLVLDAFPADRDFDVSYRFGPDAVTAVVLDGDRFETYHTYPEFDLALRSETALSERR